MFSSTTSNAAPLDQYENALVQYLKRGTGGTRYLVDLLKIWGWRNEVPWDTIPLSHLAECMYLIVERFGLLGQSFASPGMRGVMGVILDASPCRSWALMINTDGFTSNSDTLYWARIIGVLASRLYLAPVAHLPGYDQTAGVGPFGVSYS